MSSIKVVTSDEYLSSYFLYLGTQTVDAKDVATMIKEFSGHRLLFTAQDQTSYIAVDCHEGKLSGLSISVGHGETKNIKKMRQIDRKATVFGLCIMYAVGLHKAMQQGFAELQPDLGNTRKLLSYNKSTYLVPTLINEDELDIKLVRCDYTLRQFRDGYVKTHRQTDFTKAPRLKIETDTSIKV